ncbi:helix-turn-helix domain-containing protein [Streptomyces sp. NPDC012888]|uniref:helix-turn-helix domain-containing protein n=1 Tax=Streptomyces sp. NPDC012888 TaxID=3364855 RepID=UPI0036A813BB
MTQSVDTAMEPTALPSPKERRRLREAAQLTLEQVAEAVGVTATTVRSWEAGRTEPRGRTREAYAELLAGLGRAAEGSGTGTEPGPGAGPPTESTGTTTGTAPRVSGGVRAFTKGGAGRAAPAGTRPKSAAKRASKPPAAPHPAGSRGAPAGTTGSPHRDTSRTGPDGPPSATPADGTSPDGTSFDGTSPDGASPEGTAPDTPSAEAQAPAPAPAPDGAAGQARPDAPLPRADRPTTPAEAFDVLYGHTAPALARQAYLLTGHRGLAHEAVERAFQRAWAQWPAVATDPDPVGWVRAAVHEYALSPWHRFRRVRRHPGRAPADPADRALLDALLALPAAYRRTVLLYDGVGLDLPDTAAETEATTPTAGIRLLHAHTGLAARLPELEGVPPDKQSAVLHERLGSLIPAVRLEPRPARAVRAYAEYRARFWSRAAIGVTTAIAVAAAYTAVTAPDHYEPPIAPGHNVAGVPPHKGPEQLTEADRQLREKLRSEPAPGPERLVPRTD